MSYASAMFNTVYEAEWAIRALRGADIQQIEVVTHDACKRSVIVDDLVTRRRVLQDTGVEQIRIVESLSRNFFNAAKQAGLPIDGLHWYQKWLDDDFVLIIAYVSDEQVEEVTQLLIKRGGFPYGASEEELSVFVNLPEPESIGEEFPIESRWQRPAA